MFEVDQLSPSSCNYSEVYWWVKSQGVGLFSDCPVFSMDGPKVKAEPC